MSEDKEPTAGAVRMNDAGDVELFDGESWRPESSILTDANTGNREGPGSADDSSGSAALGGGAPPGSDPQE
jgi:hypothetical protein